MLLRNEKDIHHKLKHLWIWNFKKNNTLIFDLFFWKRRCLMVPPSVPYRPSFRSSSTTAQSTSKKLDGFAIVISTSAFKIGSGYSNLGYSGFTNLYVLETDFYQNTWDISANTMSLHKCTGSI